MDDNANLVAEACRKLTLFVCRNDASVAHSDPIADRIPLQIVISPVPYTEEDQQQDQQQQQLQVQLLPLPLPLWLVDGSRYQVVPPKRRNYLSPTAARLLKRWLFCHRDHPYPSPLEKRDLAARAGIQVKQLNVWFCNARRRILPGMLEEDFPYY